MSLRESNTKKAANAVKPEGAKSYTDQGKDLLDTAASYIPGESKPLDALNSDAANPNLTHDTGRQGPGPGAIGNALKPSGQQSTEEWAEEKVDQMESKLQPNDTKSIPQKARDAASPGNDTQGQGQGMYEQVAGMAQGATEQVAGMAQTAKDGVVNMVYGQKKE